MTWSPGETLDYSRPDLSDYARALVAHHEGQVARGDVSVEEVVVAMADSGSHELDHHLGRAGRFEVDFLYHCRGVRRVTYGSFHGQASFVSDLAFPVWRFRYGGTIPRPKPEYTTRAARRPTRRGGTPQALKGRREC